MLRLDISPPSTLYKNVLCTHQSQETESCLAMSTGSVRNLLRLLCLGPTPGGLSQWLQAPEFCTWISGSFLTALIWGEKQCLDF